MRIEFGTLQMTIEVKDGKLINNTPRLDMLQNNLEEVLSITPDGEYKWTVIMSTENTEKSE